MDRPEAQTGRRPKKEINYKGESFPTVLELAEHLGIQKDALARRIRAGRPEEKWSLPNQKPTIRNILYKGIAFRNITKLSNHLAIDREVLKDRIEAGWPRLVETQ